MDAWGTRSDDVALGLRVALLASVVLTTCAFTMVACSDPGVVFESCEPPRGALQVGDAELGGVICGRSHLIWQHAHARASSSSWRLSGCRTPRRVSLSVCWELHMLTNGLL